MASDFQYLTTAEYLAYNLNISGLADPAATEQQISAAEKLVDAFCGPWPRFHSAGITGVPSAVSGAVVTAGVFGSYAPGYWAAGGLYLHVYEGAGAQSERLIVSSTSAGTVTLLTEISGLDTSSKFTLRQKSIFPRYRDIDVAQVPFVPDQVKLAVAAQVAYATQAGSAEAGLWADTAVLDAKSDVTGESYGSGYSYQRNPNLKTGIARFLGPQAIAYLAGFRTITGRIRIGC